tara:strand:- start:1557 stop:1763 length:207 start_codon:yes stop_codon:yes gene_type:complete
MSSTPVRLRSFDDSHDLIIPLHEYHINLIRDIDEAEWLSDFEQADTLKREEEIIKKQLQEGEVWHPLF